MLRRIPAMFVLVPFLAAFVMAQGWWEGKPYTAWSKDEVNTILDKSPWGNLVNQSIERVGHLRTSGDTVQGTESAYDKLSFHLSFITSKPVRMALARRAILSDPGKENRTDWGKYVEQGDDQHIILVLHLTANPFDSNVALVLSNAMNSLQTADLVARTFLSTDGGKKVALAKYDPLGENGYGVKFYFPRGLPDGTPLVTSANKEIRFETVITLPKEQIERKNITISCKWDPRKMLYNGKLEL